MKDYEKLLVGVSSTMFHDNMELDRKSKKVLNKFFSRYELLSGDALIPFSSMSRNIYSAKKFFDKNKKYANIPVSAKVYVYRYKNKDAMIIIVDSDESSDNRIISTEIRSPFNKEKSYYTACMWAAAGFGGSAIKAFVNNFKKLENSIGNKQVTESCDDLVVLENSLMDYLLM